ncbi:MAG: transporter, major facilitator family [Phenylobacterium sp.]|nr:transporter, major facilitator family [Phenylobacterium sp.]
MASQSSAAKRGGWYHGWNIVAVCVLSQVASMGLPLNAFSLFLRDWSTQLHTPISSFQLAQPAFGLVTAGIAPFVGIFADKYPSRWLFGGALVAMAVFCLAMGSVTAPWQIIALYAVILPFAIGFSTAIPSNALVSRWFVRRVGLAMGLTAFGLGLGGVVLPPIVAEVLPTLGWRAVWRIGGVVIALVVVPVVLFVLRDRPSEERDGLHYLTGAAGAAHHHGHGGGTLRSRDVFKRRNFWLLLGVFLPILAAYQGVALNLAPIVRSHGFSAQAAGGFISMLSIAHLIATLATGILADRFGNRPPLVGLALITAVGIVVLAVAPPSFATLSVGMILVGLAGGVWTLLASAMAVEFGAEGFGRAFGVVAAFSPLGILAGFTVAKGQETTGSYGPPLLIFAVLALVGAALGALMRERRGGHPTPAEKQAAVEEAVTPLA